MRTILAFKLTQFAAGGELVALGSPRLVQTLIRENLVDEFRLMIEPALLGGGKRIFPDDG